MLISGLRILESTVFHNSQQPDATIASKTIERDGKKYYPRQDITVLLIMGIDEMGPVQEATVLHGAGAADMVALAIFDETNQQTRMLVLNRDTMVTMPLLGMFSKPAGTYYGQLALSHTFGSGLEDSCENTRKTVSDLLYGLNIDYYLAMNMDAIVILNDAVGGVTVNVTDDFSAVDPTITMGEITLKGQQAIHFVRTRKGVADQLNTSRMERHEQYMTGFMQALMAKKDDVSFFLTTYDQAADYIVTDCSSTVMNDLIQHYGDYPIVEIVSPAGESVLGKYYEFHLDQEALDQLILRLFYAEK
jgi:LCP family protein required for cell wall assembly